MAFCVIQFFFESRLAHALGSIKNKKDRQTEEILL